MRNKSILKEGKFCRGGMGVGGGGGRIIDSFDTMGGMVGLCDLLKMARADV